MLEQTLETDVGSRIDSVVFDIKESIDDFGFEVKALMADLNKLRERVEYLEKAAKDA